MRHAAIVNLKTHKDVSDGVARPARGSPYRWLRIDLGRGQRGRASLIHTRQITCKRQQRHRLQRYRRLIVCPARSSAARFHVSTEQQPKEIHTATCSLIRSRLKCWFDYGGVWALSQETSAQSSFRSTAALQDQLGGLPVLGLLRFVLCESCCSASGKQLQAKCSLCRRRAQVSKRQIMTFLLQFAFVRLFTECICGGEKKKKKKSGPKMGC